MMRRNTGVKFSTPIHPAGLYEKCYVAFLKGDYVIILNKSF